MKKVFRIFVISIAILLLIAGAAIAADGTKQINQARALAGGLTPGDTVGFPVTISQSGSYTLSGNLTVPNENTTAIEITADNVTLDLNGFAILGPTVCTGFGEVSCTPLGTGNGIHSENSYIRVRNGIVRGMGNDGVLLNYAPGHGETKGEFVEELQVTSNGNDGILVGWGSISKCAVDRNGGRGIATVAGNVYDNFVNLNGSIGIQIFGSGSRVSDNVVVANGSTGILAIGGLVRNNSVLQNAGGIHVGAYAAYLGNVLVSNGVSGTGLNLGQNMCDGELCP